MSICGESFAPDESFSPIVEHKLAELKAKIRQLIADSLSKALAVG